MLGFDVTARVVQMDPRHAECLRGSGTCVDDEGIYNAIKTTLAMLMTVSLMDSPVINVKETR